MIFEKINDLFTHYLYKEVSKDEIYHFQYQFEVLFSCFRKEIQDEIGSKNYELLDSIYMFFDSYEPDENIRTYDKYCIDEVTLINKVRGAYEKIMEKGSQYCSSFFYI